MRSRDFQMKRLDKMLSDVTHIPHSSTASVQEFCTDLYWNCPDPAGSGFAFLSKESHDSVHYPVSGYPCCKFNTFEPF